MSFTIKDIEVLTGIKAHTFRIWEQRYDFLQPTRTSTNLRRYSNEELKTILKVNLLYRNGYKISKINKLIFEEKLDEIKLKNESGSQLVVLQLLSFMIDSDFINFEKKLNLLFAESDPDSIITEVIFPFLEKAEIIWASHSNVSLEKIIFHYIRQKLIANSLLFDEEKTSALRFVLCLPEKEHNDLKLLSIKYLLNKKNIRVTYLGANVPAKDLIYFFESNGDASLFVHLHSEKNKKFIVNISTQIPSHVPIYILSENSTDFKDLSTSIKLYHSFSEVLLAFN